MAIDIVSTKYGQVSGVMEEGVLNFKGIPYAAPPVGELRWKPPADPAPWEGVRVGDAAHIQRFGHGALRIRFLLHRLSGAQRGLPLFECHH